MVVRQLAIIAVILLMAACSKTDAPTDAEAIETTDAPDKAMASLAPQEVTVEASSFQCLNDMTAIRHFFVDNLLGDLDATVAVAESLDGGVYPVGSVVQLVPTEVMVKHGAGWNAATKDWEFFELDVTASGNSIRNRGFVDVVNRFGGNCFACHIKAEEKFDMICELDHGCDSIPITREVIAGIQAADPRCPQTEAE